MLVHSFVWPVILYTHRKWGVSTAADSSVVRVTVMTRSRTWDRKNLEGCWMNRSFWRMEGSVRSWRLDGSLPTEGRQFPWDLEGDAGQDSSELVKYTPALTQLLWDYSAVRGAVLWISLNLQLFSCFYESWVENGKNNWLYPVSDLIFKSPQVHTSPQPNISKLLQIHSAMPERTIVSIVLEKCKSSFGLQRSQLFLVWAWDGQ